MYSMQKDSEKKPFLKGPETPLEKLVMSLLEKMSDSVRNQYQNQQLARVWFEKLLDGTAEADSKYSEIMKTLEGCDEVSFPSTWWVIVDGDLLKIINMDDVPERHLDKTFSEIIARTGCEGVVNIFTANGVWPNTHEEWVGLMAFMAAHDGTWESHPDAKKAIVGMAWTANELVNLAIPYEGQVPGYRCRCVSTPDDANYVLNQLLRKSDSSIKPIAEA